jgi:hypothetical protein
MWAGARNGLENNRMLQAGLVMSSSAMDLRDERLK